MGDFQTRLDHSANVRVCRPGAAIFDTFQNIQRIDKYVWLRDSLNSASCTRFQLGFRKSAKCLCRTLCHRYSASKSKLNPWWNRVQRAKTWPTLHENALFMLRTWGSNILHTHGSFIAAPECFIVDFYTVGINLPHSTVIVATDQNCALIISSLIAKSALLSTTKMEETAAVLATSLDKENYPPQEKIAAGGKKRAASFPEGGEAMNCC